MRPRPLLLLSVCNVDGSVSGTGILLATLTFRADAQGTTDLLMSTTLGDLTEGFALDPTGFATITFQPGQIPAKRFFSRAGIQSPGEHPDHWPRAQMPRPKRHGPASPSIASSERYPLESSLATSSEIGELEPARCRLTPRTSGENREQLSVLVSFELGSIDLWPVRR